MLALLTLVAQPLDQGPDPIGRVDVAWSAVAPILVLVGGALLLLAADALKRRKPIDGSYALLTVVIAGGAMALAVPLWQRVQDAQRGPFSTLAHSVGVDGFSVFATFVLAAAVILGALLFDGWLRREEMDGAEPYVLMLLSASGGMMMASANDLIVMFLGLEILSIAVYVLAAMHLRKTTSQEAGVKYFVLGAFSSAFFLYGIAMIYGGTGSTNLVDISSYLSTTVLGDGGLLLAGMALLLVGFGFKVAAVPFHFWTPDVYQGAPSPSVAWMASGVKVAGFAGLMRVFYLAFATYRLDWQPIVFVLAAITLVTGSVLAVVQTDVKRMLAYSSIAHAGFVLVAVQAASERGVQAALFYLASYTFMVAGSFGVVTVVGRKGDIGHSLGDYRGLSKDRPGLALVFALFLFAQAGVPLTSGFFAKFYVITAAVDAGSSWLAAIAMLSSVIAAFLYLRIV
ncbi:MAG: NADH-quinone oxidoreductase subunit N, partial [Acidimicrobiales bacterium]